MTWYCQRAEDGGWEYIIPKPTWKIRPEWFEAPGDQVSFRLESVIEEVNQKAWVVEENLLTGAVVDMLRSKGYTIIAPGANE